MLFSSKKASPLVAFVKQVSIFIVVVLPAPFIPSRATSSPSLISSDKLSTATTVITKHTDDSLKKWHIDWEQFETASLLQEVTATIDECNGTFFDYAKEVAGTRFKAFSNYNWETGTIIKLSPTRESWSETYFSKVNKNLRSLFPSTNKSQFDIYVSNIFYPKYSFANERFILDSSEFDYKIVGTFDGLDTVTVDIFRNEIDSRKLKTTIKVGDKIIDLSLSDFLASS